MQIPNAPLLLQSIAGNKRKQLRTSLAALVLLVVLRKLVSQGKQAERRGKATSGSQRSSILYESNADGSKTLFVPVRGRTTKVRAILCMHHACSLSLRLR